MSTTTKRVTNIAEAVDFKDFYSRVPDDLVIFDEFFLREIEGVAPGMSASEVLELYGLTIEDIGSISKADLKWFYLAYKRGRIRATKMTMDNLFTRMRDPKAGTQACLAFLSRFGEEWPNDIDEAGGTGKFSFQVLMKE